MTAIAIPTFDRVEYLARSLAALARIPAVKEGLPVRVFIDFSPQQQLAQQMVNYVRERYKLNMLAVLRDRHYRVMRNLVALRNEMFADYETVCLIEDDVQVTPQYLQLMLNALQWLETNYPKCVVVGSNIYAEWTEAKANAYAHHLTDSGHCLCNYVMRRSTWQALVPMFDQLAQVLDPKAQSMLEVSDAALLSPKRVELTRDWMRAYGSFPPPSGDRDFPLAFDREKSYARPVVSQDAVTDFSLRMTGFTRATTIVNRVLHFSNYGTHGIMDSEHTLRLLRMPLVERESDAALTEFYVNPRPLKTPQTTCL